MTPTVHSCAVAYIRIRLETKVKGAGVGFGMSREGCGGAHDGLREGSLRPGAVVDIAKWIGSERCGGAGFKLTCASSASSNTVSASAPRAESALPAGRRASSCLMRESASRVASLHS